MRSARQSSPNSKRTSFGRPTHTSILLNKDSCSTQKQQFRGSKVEENENLTGSVVNATIKPATRGTKPASKLSFFRSKIKSSGGKSNDLSQDVPSNFDKHERSQSSSHEAITPCTNEIYNSASRIVKPRKFGETIRIIKSVKNSVVRPSSDSPYRGKDKKSTNNDNSKLGCSSLSHDNFSQKLKFGVPFCKLKSNLINEKRVESESSLSPSKQDQCISSSVDCVQWKLEKNRTFVKADFEAAGLPTSSNNIPEILGKESGLHRTYSEDYEKNYLEGSPLSSRASSFGILNESYLLEQTFGRDAEDDLTEGPLKRQRNNTFVIRSHSKDKVLSTSSLISDFSRTVSTQDSKPKALSCTFVDGNADVNGNNNNNNDSNVVALGSCSGQVLLEKLDAGVPSNSNDGDDNDAPDADLTKEMSVRPTSMFSSCSADCGIVADYVTDEGDQQSTNKVADMRPMSIISTSSVDTGYQPDSDAENCRISNATLSSCNTSNNITFHVNSFSESSTSSPFCTSKTSPSSILLAPEMTDPNNNNNNNNGNNNTEDHNATSTMGSSAPFEAQTVGADKEDLPSEDQNTKGHELDSQGRPVSSDSFVSVPKMSMHCGTLKVFGGDADEDEDEDDYLILSNGSTLFSRPANVVDIVHMTSTPEKRVTPAESAGIKPESPHVASIKSSRCSVEMENVSSTEEATNSDSSPMENVSDEDSRRLFASHSMELSSIMEAENESLLSDECANSSRTERLVKDLGAIQAAPSHLVSKQIFMGAAESAESTIASDLNSKTSKNILTPVLEEVDTTSLLKLTSVTPEERPAESPDGTLTTSPCSELNVGSGPGGEESQSVNSCRDASDVASLSDPANLKEFHSDDVIVINEYAKEEDNSSPSVVKEGAVSTGVGNAEFNPRDEKQSVGIAEENESPLVEQPSVDTHDGVPSRGGGPSPPPSPPQSPKVEQPQSSPSDPSKGCISLQGKSNSENKTSPKSNTNNIGKSTSLKKHIDATLGGKSLSGKTIPKPEKFPKLPNSTSSSITPRNTSKTLSSSPAISSKSKLVEPLLRKNSITNRSSTPKLQKSIGITTSTKTNSVNVSLNHLADSQRTTQNRPTISSSSSSPKANDKSLSPAGSDGILENVALQGKKATPKSLFQSSTDLKSKGSGEVGMPARPLSKKPLAPKRFSVTQESSKPPGGFLRRASINVPTISTTRDKQKVGSAAIAQTTNTAMNGIGTAVKKPSVPPKPSASRNNLHAKQISIKSSLNNSFNKSANSITQLCCHDGKCDETLMQRNLHLQKMKGHLLRTTRAFEALSVVVKYFEAKVDKKHNSLMSTTKKLHQASSTLASLKEQLNMVTRQRDGLLLEVQSSEERHKKETKDLRDSMNAEILMMEKESANKLETEVNKVIGRHAEAISSLKSQHSNEFELLVENHKKALKTKEEEKAEELRSMSEQHEKKMRNISNDHKHQLDELTFRFEQMKMTLLEKVDVLRSECDDLRHRESTFMESCRREAENQVQSCLSMYKQLPQEIESLKAVLELRNQEVHELRTSNLERQREHEDLEESRRMIHFLKQKIENLEAIVDMRGDYERQLTEKHQLLLRKLERESKVNKRLSMNNEELQWKLNSAARLPGPGDSLPDHFRQFPPAMSSSFTSGVTQPEGKFFRGSLGDRRPLSVGDATQVSDQRSPSPTTNLSLEVRHSEASHEPSTPSFLSFSPPRHHSTRSARISSKACLGSKSAATTVAGSTSGQPRARAVSNKAETASDACASGDGNKLQRSGTYSLKDLERDA